jgi:hypothetical protein
LRLLYTFTELARITGVGRRRFLRLLDGYDVTLLVTGDGLLVPACELEAKLPLVWRSLLLVEAARGATIGRLMPVAGKARGSSRTG